MTTVTITRDVMQTVWTRLQTLPSSERNLIISTFTSSTESEPPVMMVRRSIIYFIQEEDIDIRIMLRKVKMN